MDNKQPEHLKSAGLKSTLPRTKILGLFESAQEHHMSAEDVYRQLHLSGDNVGLATVYRVLTQFEQAGLLVRHNFEGGKAVFELNQGKHHDHIVCLQCGHVEEFYDATIESRQKGGVRVGLVATTRCISTPIAPKRSAQTGTRTDGCGENAAPDQVLSFLN
jgi:Fur family ferric uptake transcriptional regulator